MHKIIYAIRHKKTGLWYGPNKTDLDLPIQDLTSNIWGAWQYPDPEKAMATILDKGCPMRRYLADLVAFPSGLRSVSNSTYKKIKAAAKRQEGKVIASYEIVKLDMTINMTTVRAKPPAMGERPLDI